MWRAWWAAGSKRTPSSPFPLTQRDAALRAQRTAEANLAALQSQAKSFDREYSRVCEVGGVGSEICACTPCLFQTLPAVLSETVAVPCCAQCSLYLLRRYISISSQKILL